MAGTYSEPKVADVLETFSMLYGEDLELTPGELVPLEDGSSLLAVFVNDDDEPATACVCNNNFAAFAGSALTKIPVGGAEDAAETGDFSEVMLSNVHEIMNICSRMFMNNSSPHVRLHTVYKNLDDVSEEVRNLFNNVDVSINFDITIPNYGKGTLSFLCT